MEDMDRVSWQRGKSDRQEYFCGAVVNFQLPGYGGCL